MHRIANFLSRAVIGSEVLNHISWIRFFLRIGQFSTYNETVVKSTVNNEMAVSGIYEELYHSSGIINYLKDHTSDSSALSHKVDKQSDDISDGQRKLFSKRISSKRPFTVSVEGNIGSGKSTFLKYFSSLPGVVTYQEPIKKWTDVGGYNLLGKLYEDPQRWSFLFQSYVQLTRLNIHLMTNAHARVKLIERSLHNNRYCFVESGYKSGEMRDIEYNVLCEYFDVLESNLDIGVDLIVYLQTTPDVVHQRMLKRGRAEEVTVPLSYLQRVHEFYEKWLKLGEPHKPPAPVLVINADCELETVMLDYNAKKSVILGEVPYGVHSELTTAS